MYGGGGFDGGFGGGGYDAGGGGGFDQFGGGGGGFTAVRLRGARRPCPLSRESPHIGVTRRSPPRFTGW